MPSNPLRWEAIGALLAQHAERILERLTALDGRWAGDVLRPRPTRVILQTTWDGDPGPGLKVTDLFASPCDQAFWLHVSKVGNPTARRDQKRLAEPRRADSGWTQCTARQREQRNAKQRERLANDPAWRQQRNALERQRRADSPERRERENAKKRERRRARRANGSEWRERENATKRERRVADPAWRERQNAQARQRWESDPERRERENARKRERQRRLRAQQREAAQLHTRRQDVGAAGGDGAMSRERPNICADGLLSDHERSLAGR